MTHIRKQVRNRITSIIDSLPVFANNVFENRTYELNQSELPAALIFSGPEEIEKATASHRTRGIQKRAVRTDVYIFARATVNIGDALDDLAVEVEEAIFNDQVLTELSAEVILLEAIPYIDSDSDLPVGALKMTFQVTIFAREGQPSKAVQQ